MTPDVPPVSRRRARRLALLLVSAVLILTAGGAIWFMQFAARTRRDPALIYREPGTLEKLLQRANEAERAGDRATAITTYRFVMTVAQGAGAELTPYVVAARAGLTRLGVADTPPGPSR
ncbi:MAG TPA: hypothetical protein VM716_06035 [Gemmatimonadales bacterium]|nr:hypothetical protein [Gemmatimonadales bacterium]